MPQTIYLITEPIFRYNDEYYMHADPYGAKYTSIGKAYVSSLRAQQELQKINRQMCLDYYFMQYGEGYLAELIDEATGLDHGNCDDYDLQVRDLPLIHWDAIQKTMEAHNYLCQIEEITLYT